MATTTSTVPRSRHRAIPPGVRAAALASQFARECGLPAGNLWEPGIARHLEQAWRTYYQDSSCGWACVEKEWRLRLGLLVPTTEG